METCKLKGAQLDYWVAKAEDLPIQSAQDVAEIGWSPSEKWEQAGPIIDRRGILVYRWRGRGYAATVDEVAQCASEVDAFGDTYLEAAMRCCVIAAYGKDVPDIKRSS
jgi:hypothetical protein